MSAYAPPKYPLAASTLERHLRQQELDSIEELENLNQILGEAAAMGDVELYRQLVEYLEQEEQSQELVLDYDPRWGYHEAARYGRRKMMAFLLNHYPLDGIADPEEGLLRLVARGGHFRVLQHLHWHPSSRYLFDRVDPDVIWELVQGFRHRMLDWYLTVVPLNEESSLDIIRRSLGSLNLEALQIGYRQTPEKGFFLEALQKELDKEPCSQEQVDFYDAVSLWKTSQ